MRKIVGCLVIALVAAGCRDAAAGSTSPLGPAILRIHESPSPFTEVEAGGVTAMIPDRWRPKLFAGASDAQQGFIASPKRGDRVGGRAPIEGMAVMWVDGTRIGVPSDYYYLAANGPALDALTRSPECSATEHVTVVNHRPSFADGPPDSPGDYVAIGQGVCHTIDAKTRWAYFVAAPGFGPVRTVGIPRSGLYMIVVVMRDEPGAAAVLDILIRETKFGGDSVSEFIAAARAS
ncbi:MAG: hypothetical protein ACRDHK_02950 [Actinomycetota bacterium]